MAILNNSNAISTTGAYNLTNSLRFRASASAFLSRTPGTAGNRRTWTWSGWIKRGSITANSPLFTVSQDSANFTVVRFGPGTTDKLEIYTIRSSVDYSEETVALFRDPSAWYHVVFSVDTTQATASNRIRIYVNGVQQITTQFYGQIPQNEDTFVNTANAHNICRNTDTTTQHFDGYLDEVNFIDGQALTPSSFGSFNTTTGVWQPERYTGTYGTNGFYLNFTDIALTSGSNTGLGRDFSGNGNFWNTNNISVTAGTTYDAMSDVPTLTSATAANYATWNPVVPYVAGIALSNGNLNIAYSSGSGATGVLGTIGIASGKWYWEYTFTASNPNFYLGWRTPDGVIYFGVGCSTGNVLTETSSGSFSGSTVTVANGDVIGVAFDYAAGACYYYKNNTLFFTLTGFTTSNSTLFPIRNIWSSGGGASSGATNFGQRPFAYTPPSGYLGLNTFNLPDSTIVKGNVYMDATLYTGTGSSQTIVNAGGFRPDFVWIKCRSVSNNNSLFDSTRGATAQLFSNLTNAEAVGSDGFTSFNSNGFSLDNSGSGGNVNVSGRTYVGWQWNANNGTTSTNTNGSTTSTVQANTTAGFSIVTYTGTGSAATVGHGLGVAPRMIIIKRRNGAVNWPVFNINIGNQFFLQLNTTDNATNQNVVPGGNWWNNTNPTSSVFSIGTIGDNNASGGTFVAYCWAEIAGFSKFGSYVGNFSADGPFVYTGFRPEFILGKDTTVAGQEWFIYDTARNTFNVANRFLSPTFAQAETASTGVGIDILSNGFKIRMADNRENRSGSTYIYMAFAENPFKNANAR
jgi:hypothetical protein